MPIAFAPRWNDSARLAAWESHYIAKGCSPRKARECAARKQHGSTWPKSTPND